MKNQFLWLKKISKSVSDRIILRCLAGLAGDRVYLSAVSTWFAVSTIMQHVFIEKPYKFLPPFKAKWPIKLIMLTGIYKRWLRKLEGVESAEVRNHEKLQADHHILRGGPY